jgi:membrane protein required for colicin V production
MNTADLVRDRFRGWIGNPDFADPAAWGAMFLLALVFLSVLTGMLGNLVRASGLGGIDRTVGVAYGALRGAALVVAAYFAGGFVVAPERWPEPVQQARLLPTVHDAAAWVAVQLPPNYRPSVPQLPPQRETRATDLLHATPQGRATARR